MHTIRARSASGETAEVKFNYYPDICPVCMVSAEIKRDLAEAYLCPATGEYKDRFLQIVFRCPRLTCGSHFIVEYAAERDHRAANGYGKTFRRSNVFPCQRAKPTVPDSVANASPNFVEVYRDSLDAENSGLTSLAGMGHRKALEFLIKDYCIAENPTEDAKIRKMPLMQCITAFVADPSIKECATRAVWLGNDETHYERIWTAHDLGDLKILIELTIHWIQAKALTAKYIAQMQKP